EGAMGHVWIVAGVLDHARCRRGFAEFRGGKREAGAAPAAWQRDLHRLGKLAGEQGGIGGLGGSRSAGPGCPAAAEWGRLRCHEFRYTALRSGGHSTWRAA